ncbi:CPBP family intramembrane glutamic endopeptidase [Corynebacterium pseudotuberculosis]|uniref:CPBP family intramembrane glutamic endopeptidase n=1 Tax=Corynebacterium pseudotuberculosis TaxID=1719 RepID=UPI00026603BD|nr:type II CAAX endopeptidase family protein [Corynebacterium pseudotuberculosis]WFP66898.1 type II CAAX endopeptidase family protein [Corynebacterium pseudotuberculosis]
MTSDQKLSFNRQIIVRVLYIIAYFFLVTGLPMIVGDDWGELAVYIGTGVAAVLGLFLFRDRVIAGLKSLKEKRLKLVLSVIGFIVFQAVVVAIATKVVPGFGDSANQSAAKDAINGSLMVATILTLAVFAPIAEELVFREAMMGWAPGKVSLTIATLVSGLLFVYLHASFTLTGFIYYLPGTASLIAIYLLFKRNIAAINDRPHRVQLIVGHRRGHCWNGLSRLVVLI